MPIIGFWNNLEEVRKLVKDELLAGVIQEIVEEGGLLPRIPVGQIDSGSLIYNRESTLPTAGFYAIGAEIPTQQVGVYTQETAELKRCIGQFDLDNFILKTYTNPNDMKAVAVNQARKGMMRTIENKLIYGSATANPEEPNGIFVLCNAGMKVNSSGALSIGKVRLLLDMMKYKPQVLLVGKYLGRMINAVPSVGLASTIPTVRYTLGGQAIDLGMVVGAIEGVPIVETDYLGDEGSTGAEWVTGTVYHSMYAIHFAPVGEGGLCLLTGNPMLEYKEMDLTGKDAIRFRLVWYLALALGSTKALGMIYGCTEAPVIA